MELLQVMGRPEQKKWSGARLAFDEIGIAPIPAVLDGALVDDLDLGRRAVNHKLDRQTRGKELLIVGDVFPKEAKVLGGERMPVGPFVAVAQLEGELATILGLVACEKVRMKLEFVVIDDQACVAVSRHQPGIACVGD